MSVFSLARRPTKGRPRAASLAVALTLLACGPPDRPSGALDDLGAPLPPPRVHARIVSLSPATTELLFALGAGDRVVGRTHWDGYPPAALAVPDLGDGIRPSVEVILAARPDLVVLYATADNADAARAFRAAGIDVIALRMDRIEDFERVARVLGDATGAGEQAEAIVDSVGATLDRVRAATDTLPHPGVFLHNWEQPLIAIGGGSYLSQLVEIAGGGTSSTRPRTRRRRCRSRRCCGAIPTTSSVVRRRRRTCDPARDGRPWPRSVRDASS